MPGRHGDDTRAHRVPPARRGGRWRCARIVARRPVLAVQHGWVAPLPPEGASEILYRTVERAPELAAAQGVRSIDLAAAGIVDRIVPERPDAADEPRQFLNRLSKVLEYELTSLIRWDKTERLGARHRRYRRLGLHQEP